MLSENTAARPKSLSMIRTYSELSELETFEERFNYLKLDGQVGIDTFGFDRHLNQKFYRSAEWRRVRKYVLARDLGCDLGIEGHDIFYRPLIHHMNPITPKDIVHGSARIIDPEYLITTTHETHNAIHYGDPEQLPRQTIERKPGDTKLW